MVNSQKMMFFAVKLIAPKIGDPKMNTGDIRTDQACVRV